MTDPFQLLARTSGSPPAAGQAMAAMLSTVEPAERQPLALARALKRELTRLGFRDDPDALTLGEALDRRGGSCLLLTLVVGAELVRRGLAPGFVLLVNPHDDIYDLSERFFRALLDPEGGIDDDSRLPDAGDRCSRYRLVPVEHAALRLRDDQGRERPFECTGLGREWADLDAAWAPPCEREQRATFAQLASTVLVERAKALLARQGDDPAALRQGRRLAAAGARAFPDHAEGWAVLWEVARALDGRRPDPAGAAWMAIAERRHLALAAEDSAWHLARYRMTGDARHLDAALAAFPAFAEAYYERRVGLPLAQPLDDEAQARAARAFNVVAWCHAESEILDLARFYASCQRDCERLFGVEEHRAIRATFPEAVGAPLTPDGAAAPGAAAGSRAPDRGA